MSHSKSGASFTRFVEASSSISVDGVRHHSAELVNLPPTDWAGNGPGGADRAARQMQIWWGLPDSNREPRDYESCGSHLTAAHDQQRPPHARLGRAHDTVSPSLQSARKDPLYSGPLNFPPSMGGAFLTYSPAGRYIPRPLIFLLRRMAGTVSRPQLFRAQPGPAARPSSLIIAALAPNFRGAA